MITTGIHSLQSMLIEPHLFHFPPVAAISQIGQLLDLGKKAGRRRHIRQQGEYLVQIGRNIEITADFDRNTDRHSGSPSVAVILGWAFWSNPCPEQAPCGVKSRPMVAI